MKVLVVQDERKAAAHLREGLAENGFVVDVAHDGADQIDHGRPVPPGDLGENVAEEVEQLVTKDHKRAAHC